MALQEDVWYAVNSTEVFLYPKQTLETFGTTVVEYHLIAELMDEVGKVRVRTGRVYSERPQIIVPSQYADQLVEGFGEEAQEYAEWLLENGNMMKILKYGLKLRKDNTLDKTISGTLEDVKTQIKKDLEVDNNQLTALIHGVDEQWEISLLKFLSEYVQKSIPVNIHQINSREKADENAFYDELERDFISARGSQKRINLLGEKLKHHNLFERYEDRFFALIKQSR
ncbi:MAG: hypothetical protein U9O87_05560 [Verrucomicrobiota bacterium]|nr:hypothetical protein [Verrucomicrobiota bacterium]